MSTPHQECISPRRHSTPLSPLTPPPASPPEMSMPTTPENQSEHEAPGSKSSSPKTPIKIVLTSSPKSPVKIVLKFNKRSADEISDDLGQEVPIQAMGSNHFLPSEGIAASIPMPIWKEVDWNPPPRPTSFTRRFKDVAPEETRVPRTATGLHIDRTVVEDPDHKMTPLTILAYRHQGILPASRVDDHEGETPRLSSSRRIQVSGEKFLMTEQYFADYFAQFCNVQFERVRKMKISLPGAPETWRALEFQFATAEEAQFCEKTLDLHPSFQVCVRWVKNSPKMGS